MDGDTIVTILRRLIDSSQKSLSPAAAEAILSISFSEADQAHIQELAALNTSGILGQAQTAEYDSYIAASDLLSLWKSKARQTLKQRTSAA